MAAPPSTDRPGEESDASYDVFSTAPNSPETFYSLPSSPTTKTSKVKHVRFAPSPPKMNREQPQSPIDLLEEEDQVQTTEDRQSPDRQQSASGTATLPEDQTKSGSATPPQDQTASSTATSSEDQTAPAPPTMSKKQIKSALKSKNFQVMCAQAVQLARAMPHDPPPTSFLSLDQTIMHPWYESLVAMFIECFARKLRGQNAFPQKPSPVAIDGTITTEEDHAAFEAEVIAHVNAIFRSFNTNWHLRRFGSTENLLIDNAQPRAAFAAQALQEATEPAYLPPKENWKHGEPLHPWFQMQIRRFRGGVFRLIEESERMAFLLTVPEELEKAIRAYEVTYMATVRKASLKWLAESAHR